MYGTTSHGNPTQQAARASRWRHLLTGVVAMTLYAADASGAEYTVQIGTFDRPPAAGFTDNAAANGELVTSPGPNGWTRYSIGRFGSSADARDTLAALQSAGYYDAFIMRLDGPGASVAATRDADTTQAGRFRIRTFDTSSGEKRDFEPGMSDAKNSRAAGSTPAPVPITQPVEPTELPEYLRDKLVYLDGIPHIKDGDRFVPLTDAIDE